MAKLRGKVQMNTSFQTLVGKDFVDNVIENEVIEFERVKKIKEGYASKLVRIIEKSQNRVQPICPVYEKCGGCQMLHRSYESQKEIKKVQMINASKHLNLKVYDVVGEEPYFYRNKLIASFGKKNGKTICGLYSTYSHELVEIKKCYLHDEIGDELISKVLKVIIDLKIQPYNEDRKTGFIRHVIVRRAVKLNQSMITLVVSNKDNKLLNLIKNKLLQICRVDCIVANINNRSTSILLGEQEIILHGKGYIQDELCGLKFNISSKSFYQINHTQTEKLYEKAIKLANLKSTDTIIDTYSGIGTIGFILSKYVKHVYSVELNKDASKDAIINAKLNQLKNVSIINDDATKYMQNLAKTKMKIDCVIMDPTRSGSTKEFMDSCKALNVNKIVYISCNPLTQIRDLEYFKKIGYQCNEMYLYDLFPNTAHVESVVLISRKK